MAKLRVTLNIDYDGQQYVINDYNFGSKGHTLGEISVIIATFKYIMEEWGYNVKRAEEANEI